MIRFDANGNIHPSSHQQINATFSEPNVVILVHGWNVTEITARRTYQTWFPTGPAPIIKVHWPATLINMDKLKTANHSSALGVPGQLAMLANLTGYYRMRKRAVQIGRNGLAPMVKRLLQNGVRCHIVGHSFGALAVIAAVHAVTEAMTYRGSITTCLAACSHYVFAHQYDGIHDGAYRHLATTPQLRAPLLVVHSKNDTVLNIPYALASRLASHEAVFAGTALDRYGALGVNGALRTPEARTIPYSRAARLAQPGITNVPAHELLTQHSNLTRLDLPQFMTELIRTTEAYS